MIMNDDHSDLIFDWVERIAIKRKRMNVALWIKKVFYKDIC